MQAVEVDYNEKYGLPLSYTLVLENRRFEK